MTDEPDTMIAERRFTAKKGQNIVSVRVTGHSWVALTDDAGERIREQSGEEEASFAVEPGRYVIRTDGKIDSVATGRTDMPFLSASEKPELAFLRLSSDATDLHPVDGIGEIAADGESFVTITVEKLSAEGEPLTRRRDSDEVFFRTTGGQLHDKDGRSIRSLKLKAGKGSIRLVSESVPKVVTVEALAPRPIASAELRLEFV